MAFLIVDSEITAASSDNRVVAECLGSCVGWNRAGSNLAVHFDFFFPCQFF